MTFDRLKVGVGRDAPVVDLASFVLEKFAAAERDSVRRVVDAAVTCSRIWLNDGSVREKRDFSLNKQCFKYVYMYIHRPLKASAQFNSCIVS